jgi:hypothetical protein
MASTFLFTNNPPQSWYVIVLLVGGPTSAVSSISNAATSYAHCSSLFSYEFADTVALNATYYANFTSFLDSGVASILDAMLETKFGEYYGHADPTLRPRQAHEVRVCEPAALVCLSRTCNQIEMLTLKWPVGLLGRELYEIGKVKAET